MLAERKADREELKGMMKAFQERTDANTEAIKDDIKLGQEEMRSIFGAFQGKMEACVASRRDNGKEAISCQERRREIQRRLSPFQECFSPWGSIKRSPRKTPQ
jgi:hypothetical protein